ncbi:MAG: hypothetical protein KDE14_00585 [Rhodobacteraceae bacterium]|nr:hypothetical protein [Paracoccaceae bacterium]
MSKENIVVATEHVLDRSPLILKLGTAVLAAFVLASCIARDGVVMPKPASIPHEKRANDVAASLTSTADGGGDTIIQQGLKTPIGRTTAEPYMTEKPPKLSGENISVTFDGISLPMFVNTVFGELLKVTFEIDDAVAKRDQLVTLRTATAITPNDFFRLVQDVLQNYGIAVVYQNNVYRVVESANRREDLPRIIWSRAVRNVPGELRPIFQFVQLKNVQTAFMTTWLGVALQDRVRIQGVNEVNGLLLMGKSEDVAAALETIQVLDQPHMAGSSSVKIVPRYWSADKLATQLVDILVAEGYGAGVGSGGTLAIKFIPVPPLNTIIVFTSDGTTMEHVMSWARELDQPSQSVNTIGVFYYQVQNSSASALAEVLTGALGKSANGESDADGGAAARAATTSAITSPTGGQVIVDAARNALIFRGTAEEYSQFRSLAEQMDRPPLQVLIEATIAEVTLNEGEDLGATLSLDTAATAAPRTTTIASDSGLLVSLVRDRGDFVGSLNASANKNKVTILSSPRVVASSGNAASINVGTQVPIITSQQTDPSGSVGGTSTLLQDVQYRATGVALQIKPEINSNRRVELTISQEVSEAQANKISTVQSPTIFTRSITTSLSLNDGQTVLLGGLISENYSDGNTGIPVLKDIPLIGNIFKTQSRGRTRIELIVLLTPYIIDGPEATEFVRDAFKSQLEQLPAIPVLNLEPDSLNESR